VANLFDRLAQSQPAQAEARIKQSHKNSPPVLLNWIRNHWPGTTVSARDLIDTGPSENERSRSSWPTLWLRRGGSPPSKPSGTTGSSGELLENQTIKQLKQDKAPDCHNDCHNCHREPAKGFGQPTSRHRCGSVFLRLVARSHVGTRQRPTWKAL
jgi:hypothetical protein